MGGLRFDRVKGFEGSVLPGRGGGKAAVEGVEALGLIVSGEGAVEEAGKAVVEQFAPGGPFLAGDDGEEEEMIVGGGLVVAGGVADHENVVEGVFAGGGEGEVFGFGALFLAGDEAGEAGDVVFLPFADEVGGGGLGDDEAVGVGVDLFEGGGSFGDGGKVVDDEFDGGGDIHGPVEGAEEDAVGHERGAVGLDVLAEDLFAEAGFGGDPGFEFGGVDGGSELFEDFRAVIEKLEGADEGFEAVEAAGVGVEVDEVPGFAGRGADALETEAVDEGWAEAFLVFKFHAVEDAAVGIHADKKFR